VWRLLLRAPGRQATGNTAPFRHRLTCLTLHTVGGCPQSLQALPDTADSSRQCSGHGKYAERSLCNSGHACAVSVCLDADRMDCVLLSQVENRPDCSWTSHDGGLNCVPGLWGRVRCPVQVQTIVPLIHCPPPPCCLHRRRDG
jgi:hypothetical protein